MSGNYWVVKVEKNSDGKIYLKFWGQIPIPVKYVGYVIVAITVLSSAVSYVIH